MDVKLDSVKNALDTWASFHCTRLAQRAAEVEEKAKNQARISKGLQDSAREKQEYIDQAESASQKLLDKYNKAASALEVENKLSERIHERVDSQERELRALQKAEAERLGQESCPAFQFLRRKDSRDFFAIPGSVLASIFGFLSTTDLDHSVQACKAWENALNSANVWKHMARALYQRSLAPSEEPPSAEMTHKHYCLAIEIGKDSYIVGVDVTEVSSMSCTTPEFASKQSKVESDRKGITITICSLNTAGLMDEAVFCSALVTEHTALTQAKLDKARAQANLDNLLGLKQITNQDIAAATIVAQQVETDIDHVQMQHQSDECTTQLLEEQLASVETRVMASEMETTNILQFLAKEIKAKTQQLAEFDQGSANADANSAAVTVAQEYDGLKQQKAVLARELKNLKEKIEITKKDRAQAEANYLTLLRKSAPYSADLPSPAPSPVYLQKLSVASSPPSSNPPSPQSRRSSATSPHSAVSDQQRKSSISSISERKPSLPSSTPVNIKMPRPNSILSSLNPFSKSSSTLNASLHESASTPKLASAQATQDKNLKPPQSLPSKRPSSSSPTLPPKPSSLNPFEASNNPFDEDGAQTRDKRVSSAPNALGRKQSLNPFD